MTERFVTQKEIDEAREVRQKEWEKVRKASDPLEAPEEPVDNRSLYERLKEVRDKKQAEFEEDHKFKNMVRGLDSDESDFLSMVDNMKQQQERLLKEEEKLVLSECERSRSRAVSDGQIPSVSSLRPVISNKPKTNKQAEILRSAIKRRSTNEDGDNCKRPSSANIVLQQPTAAEVIGVLPGIASYTSTSSDSESESENSGSGDVVLPLVNSNYFSSESESDDESDSSTDDQAVLPVLVQADKMAAKSKQSDSCEE
ncbi:hypothetical protein AB6A40_004268 [Gnathostoma spinigerum]|uniref:FAM192A/Fyv6 N-terminal domain-containing protein n=1 Tax=Gnathostoma spinigerum TaxID=75299 RepID=A0ABD6EHD4_9BILA